ncbi:AAA domain-containing protein [Desulfobotulus alkaliphilus]|uniref:AAA domain-containing protein n=1 Tax=Desulfobotulus alkaliphilus TaxID=622671 RepID=A0A562QZ23_9BACT|nr:AAA-like domain-containing protein [Desulfobotulus alkaliphilus]TWI62071.1 AAA domain-containing protein [Desulfobotulus alkaliphilus]
MEKFFNNAGPVMADMNYHIDPLTRINWDEVYDLILQQRYFILHAPRQTGKTSSLIAMMHALNKKDDFTALYVNIEGAQAARNNVEAGISAVCSAFARSASHYLNDPDLEPWIRKTVKEIPAEDRLSSILTAFSERLEKPLVLMLDEVDALVGDTLISLLRQLRAGYEQRPKAFPQSLILCGVRDIRDYRIHTAHQEIITGGSAFNIKAASLRLGNFTEEECKELWLQHTQETGQIFDDKIFPELWEDTKGQPWLVNALAHELTWNNKEARDRSKTLFLEDYFAAREKLIQSRQTHLDQLTDKLREPRVHKVISALLSTDETELLMPRDDMDYVEDLGLIHRKPNINISNRIYREIIPRELTVVTQDTMIQKSIWYTKEDSSLDMTKLLLAFQQFFRENSESWIERFDYKEAGPQLLMQAFLQRIINGGGRVNREYGLGSRRTDLFLEWPLDKEKGFFGPVQRVVIELKILRKGLENTIKEGLEQTADYADKTGAGEAHLVIFNRKPEIPWEEKVWNKTMEHGKWTVGVWGM